MRELHRIFCALDELLAQLVRANCIDEKEMFETDIDTTRRKEGFSKNKIGKTF